MIVSSPLQVESVLVEEASRVRQTLLASTEAKLLKAVEDVLLFEKSTQVREG